MRPINDYDSTLKKVLTRASAQALRHILNAGPIEWLNVELNRRGSLRVDLLGRTRDGRLIHVELQSHNERRFWVRMGEYGFAIARQYGQYPIQVALYVGRAPLRMSSEVQLAGFEYRFHLIDIRSVATQPLLESPNPGDNVIAVLTQDGASPAVVRRVLEKIAQRSPADRPEALEQLLSIAGLRSLGKVIRREVNRMPVMLRDVDQEHPLEPWLRKAESKGRLEGQVEGRLEGQVEGRLALLLELARKRFGSIPIAVQRQLKAMTPRQLDRAGIRLLDATRPEQLLGRRVVPSR